MKKQMIPEIYRIKNFNKGFLATMAKPRSGDWLEDEIHGLAVLGINVVVSLLEFGEEYELGLTKEKSICKAHQIEFISFPIKDFGIPDSAADTAKLAHNLLEKLVKDEKSAVIHCRGGIGRSSLVAACVLYMCRRNTSKCFNTDFKGKRSQCS
ncbi:MAG: protein tyrosine phosphatase [Desulfobacterales bacterium]|nr:protein tyrosine phosphatase [Desulfobacterales bacterium]